MELPKYVYDIPYSFRRRLCMSLDADGDWKRLGLVHFSYVYQSDTSCVYVDHYTSLVAQLTLGSKLKSMLQ